MADAKTVWQRRSEAAAEQERTLLAKIKEHNAEAREQRLNGEMVFRVWYKDGGIVKRRTEVFIDERNESPIVDG